MNDPGLLQGAAGLFGSPGYPVTGFDGGMDAIAGRVQPFNPLTLLLPFIAALVISMVVIPVMVRLARKFGLIDEPDPRKVHEKPIPRAGGFGIVLGTLVPIMLLLDPDRTILAFLAGGVVMFVFGVLDDSRGLGHYAKFAGQFIAVAIVVYGGGVYVSQLPFLQDYLIGETAGKLFTVIAMVGMINAMNHSDGLDGLAGGEALLSLCGIAWLSFVAGGVFVTFMALSLAGGVLGFMRFNTYPAIIFMGDSGSQFIGYTLGFLAVMLTQQVNPALSPALPLLFLGLPIADIIAVFVQRIYKRMNWFRATRNHIHHRLLDLGFYHYESVVIIYTVQTVLVVSAMLMSYESDMAVAGLYLLVVAAVFLLLVVAERSGCRVHDERSGRLSRESLWSSRIVGLSNRLAYAVLAIGLSVFLVTGSLLATRIPSDITLLAMVLGGMMLVRMCVPGMVHFLPLRALCYMTIAFIVYLVNTYQPEYLTGADPVTYLFFGLMVIAIGLAIRFSEKGDFTLTPTDFLVIIVVCSLALLSSRNLVDTMITAITLKAIILFYGCELVLNRMRHRWNIFTASTLVSLLLVSLRGMGLVSIDL